MKAKAAMAAGPKLPGRHSKLDDLICEWYGKHPSYFSEADVQSLGGSLEGGGPQLNGSVSEKKAILLRIVPANSAGYNCDGCPGGTDCTHVFSAAEITHRCVACDYDLCETCADPAAPASTRRAGEGEPPPDGMQDE